jgi:hypothetical protein
MGVVEQRITEIMRIPIEELIDPAHHVRADQGIISLWRLPESDLGALVEFGLPDDLLMQPEYQGEAEPRLACAADSDRLESGAGVRCEAYDLGHWGANEFTPRMGVQVDEGRVLAFPSVAHNPLEERLVEGRECGHAPRSSPPLLSSSLTRFVSISWRWRAARDLMLNLPRVEWPFAEEDVLAEYDQRESYARLILAEIENVDPALPAEVETPWHGLVMDVV